MTDSRQTAPQPLAAPSRSILRSLLFPGLFFVGGIGATAWFLTATESGTNLVAPAPAPIAVDAARLAAPTGVTPPDLVARITELEMRIARAEAAPSSPAGGAAASDRATGLVIAFAARRALERGQPLGPIEAELRAHFGDTQPHLLTAIVSAAQNPVTLDQLRTEFDGLAPGLTSGSVSWWARLTSLITVRDAAQSPADSPALLKRASAALDQGRVSAALAAVAQLPGRARANDWIEKAKRFVAADAALSELEASAFKGQPAPVPGASPAIVLPEPDMNEKPASPVF